MAVPVAPPTPPDAPQRATARGLTVREASISEYLDWDRLVAGFPQQRLVHKRAWTRSLEACGKGQLLYLVFEREGEPVGYLPGLLSRVGPLRLFGSPLPGWQTVSLGPVFDARRLGTRDLATALVAFLDRRYRIDHVELMTDALDADTMREAGFRGAPVCTYRAPLFPGDEARAFQALHESARRNIRRAAKLGLVVRFEDDDAFVDEHYDQMREVYLRGGNVVPFSKQRVLECFRHLRAAGHLLAVSASLPDGPRIATGMFFMDGRELLLWTWAHRTRYRWYRPTELMTWTVIQRAMAAGCSSFDLMGGGDFKAKFGGEPDLTKYRWVWSRHLWIAQARNLAGLLHGLQQSVRGRALRLAWRAAGAFAPVAPNGTRQPSPEQP